MKLTWQADRALALTSVSPELRVHLKLDEAPKPVTARDIAGPDTPSDFGVIAHEWALEGDRVQFDLQWDGIAYAAQVEPLLSPAGEVVGVAGFAQPKSDKIAGARRATLAAHAEAIGASGSWYYDAKSAEYEWSDGLFALLGADVWMPFTRNVRMFDAPEDAKMVEQIVEHARLTHEPYSIDHRVVRLDGGVRHVQERAVFYFDEDGEFTHAIGSLIDITDRKRSESRLAYLAFHDSLSELPNRAMLEERFAVALERARHKASFCGILFLDIDGFKAINDTYGHAGGDDLLRAIAGRLRRNVRAGDTLARFGGDEFVILLDELSDPLDAEIVARTVLETFENPFTLGNFRITVTASAGIAVAPPDGVTLQELLAKADAGMYRAKRGGGNAAAYAELALIAGQMVG
jgi:diguanylate cyclase (GGDEF)-like protein/PAS domain S-box-containing protein